MAHGELYARQFGFSTDFEALVAEIVGDYAAKHSPDKEAAWTAEIDGERAGCVFLVPPTSRAWPSCASCSSLRLPAAWFSASGSSSSPSPSPARPATGA
jgi:hypothetical protein